MKRRLFWTLILVPALVFACGGSQQHTDGNEKEGAAERAGKDLDHAAADVKGTGDKVGSEVGESLGNAGEDVKNKLGIGESRDAGAPKDAGVPKDGG
jgi:hypothetical protein